MSKALNELIKELGKIVDGSNQLAEEMDKLKSLYEKLKFESAKEFDYPFEDNQRYWSLNVWGDINSVKWENKSFDTEQYDQGHVFKTEQEAIRERDKRTLMTRFRQFRDKCNGEWKADFKAHNIDKYALFFNRHHDAFFVEASATFNHFNLFGYFKNEKDAELAIELFGDKIKRLFVEEK